MAASNVHSVPLRQTWSIRRDIFVQNLILILANGIKRTLGREAYSY